MLLIFYHCYLVELYRPLDFEIEVSGNRIYCHRNKAVNIIIHSPRIIYDRHDDKDVFLKIIFNFTMETKIEKPVDLIKEKQTTNKWN